jgi:predicted 2-oxoglutarate/Fe(II)-dependent dioxygenase YbiX
MDTQTTLGLHTDASLFTGSVKLNDNYSGAELIFPRQNFTNKDVPVGKCILFPGMVTHGHSVNELLEGVKYSLTMWTSRYKGDLNE